MAENSLNPIAKVSEADWEKTPESVKQLVQSLLERLAEIERQQEEIKAENQLLKERVQQRSQNSSKPPSQDVDKGFKVKQKKKSEKQRGAQPEHEGHDRPLYPIEQCQQVEEHYPETCLCCGGELHGMDTEPYRVQIVELPKVVLEIREHRFQALECQACGTMTRAWNEGIINGSGYGERVVAHVGVLSGQYRQSHRMVQELLLELYGLGILEGSINQLRQESSKALKGVVEEAHQYVQAQSQVKMDETSFAQGNSDGNNPTGSKGWLWVMVTPLVSYVAVFLSRFSVVLRPSVLNCWEMPSPGYWGVTASVLTTGWILPSDSYVGRI